MATPLETVKNQHGSKANLVNTLLPLLDRDADETEAEFKERLSLVSNAKLLRLLARTKSVKDGFGSREVLADKIVALSGGDADFKNKIMGFTTGRLLDMHKVLSRKVG